MNYGRIHRLLRLITLLQSGRAYRLDELMAELGVSRRTVFRDLNTLELAGIPYFHDPDAGYRIHRSFFLPPINLTIPETLGLMVLGKTAAAQRDKPMVGPALSAINKLISVVPEPIRAACGEMMTNVSVGPFAQVSGASESRHFTLLQQCIDEGRICQGRYHSPVEAQTMTFSLNPYAMHFASRAWYVLGPTDMHNEVRLFKLNRF
jgi:predicted DNA-binding transcriptional regulator YafY